VIKSLFRGLFRAAFTTKHTVYDLPFVGQSNGGIVEKAQFLTGFSNGFNSSNSMNILCHFFQMSQIKKGIILPSCEPTRHPGGWPPRPGRHRLLFVLLRIHFVEQIVFVNIP